LFQTPESNLLIAGLWQIQHARLCAFSTAIGLAEGSTQLLKVFVQRRRPNFYALCGWDSTSKTCTAPIENLREANSSFPSGHSSLSACAMTAGMWQFLGLIVAVSSSKFIIVGNGKKKRQVRSLELTQCSAFFAIVVPLGWAIFVAATRLVDHWHHPSDVLAGLVLGATMGTIGYHLWFPPIWWMGGRASNLGPSHPWSVHAWHSKSIPEQNAMEKLVSF
jgi:diacylglycerol diphosphate phosphatase / phosphatidate phosphatase